MVSHSPDVNAKLFVNFGQFHLDPGPAWSIVVVLNAHAPRVSREPHDDNAQYSWQVDPADACVADCDWCAGRGPDT